MMSKIAKFLAIFVEFPGAYDQALRVWGRECRGGKKLSKNEIKRLQWEEKRR